jgi:hypothetical protein
VAYSSLKANIVFNIAPHCARYLESRPNYVAELAESSFLTLNREQVRERP